MLEADQLKVFLAELEIFLKSTQREQKYQLANKVPSLKEYWDMRLGTVCVGPCLALAE